MRWMFVLMMALASSSAIGSIGSDLESFFGDLNYVNVTRPGVYEGQAAGYYTGGGLYARVPVRSYQILNVQMPRFRAGCGGIDLYTGGFSHINADAFVEMLRNIGSNAKSLAFMLALQVVSPQISEVMSKVQSWAQEANLASINSCEAATRLVGGALELFGATEQQCILNRTQKMGEDYNTARVACRGNPNQDGSAPGEEPLIFTDGNLAWRSMMPIDFFRNNLDLAEAAMNLTGSVVIRLDKSDPNPEPDVRRVPSMLLGAAGSVEASGLMEVLLRGGEASIYRCVDLVADVAGCQEISNAPQTVSIPPGSALVPQVRAILEDLLGRIVNDGPAITAEQLGLLRSTSLPLYKFLTVNAALFPSVGESEVANYSEIVAQDLLYVYVLDLLRRTEDGAARLRENNSRIGTVEGFIDDIRLARSSIRNAQILNNGRMDAALRMTNATRQYEAMLVSTMSPDVVQATLFGTSR